MGAPPPRAVGWPRLSGRSSWGSDTLRCSVAVGRRRLGCHDDAPRPAELEYDAGTERVPERKRPSVRPIRGGRAVGRGGTRDHHPVATIGSAGAYGHRLAQERTCGKIDALGVSLTRRDCRSSATESLSRHDPLRPKGASPGTGGTTDGDPLVVLLIERHGPGDNGRGGRRARLRGALPTPP